MKQIKIDKKLFIENRKRLTKELKPNSLVVVHANDVMPTNADGTMHFKQNTDLFWLTGVDQEETVLVLFPDSPDPAFKEVLFLRETSELIAIWEGKKLMKDEATELTGIQNIVWLSDFNKIFRNLVTDAENINWCKENYPIHNYCRLAPIINKLRMFKSPIEIELMQKACDLTDKAFRRVLKFVKPGVMEYEIEAEFAHEFIRNGSTYADYYPIIASGPSACVLHYVVNDKPCKDGDVILIDTGASYSNYNADMTRCVP
ncbi:MAG: aminopeptidase P N-terminal domain-containing protein, partial [Ignavibacteriae bacterium]|nr:aminopeptidase P N-terminal domain-containing protein [Ignavibacteriota bacterium]